MGGQTTNARITIGQIVDVRIGKDAGGFNWDNGVLHHSYFFNAELPNSVDLGGSTQKWLVNGQEAGKEQSLSINLPLKQGRNDFDIVYEVTLKDGCISSGSTTIRINYPDFN